MKPNQYHVCYPQYNPTLLLLQDSAAANVVDVTKSSLISFVDVDGGEGQIGGVVVFTTETINKAAVASYDVYFGSDASTTTTLIGNIAGK